MKDFEIEERLRKYRPVGPPVELRARILRAAPMRRVWPWAGAAAALLLSTIGLNTAVRSKAAHAEVRLEPSPAVRVAEDLASRLGDGPGARDLAEFMVAEQRIRNEAATPLSSDDDAPLRGSQR